LNIGADGERNIELSDQLIIRTKIHTHIQLRDLFRITVKHPRRDTAALKQTGRQTMSNQCRITFTIKATLVSIPEGIDKGLYTTLPDGQGISAAFPKRSVLFYIGNHEAE
jgi:hypothetical protein